MQVEQARDSIERQWNDGIVDELVEYIRIPAKSPHFDPDWAKNGYLDKAAEHILRWCKEQPIAGLSAEIVRLDERTPVVFVEVAGSVDETVLLYGHLDKQPEMTGWTQGLGPWKPVIRDGRLYGRGGADDGYAAYASLAAIRALQEQNRAHARFVIIIEACEESGSYDLPAYIEHLSDRIGSPSLVVCLDSGAGNYDQLWVTTSLRGMASGTLYVDILKEGVHSGMASGIVPSSFRIARQLISRLEDEVSGEILLDELKAEVPEQRHRQLAAVARTLGDQIHGSLPLVQGARPMGENALAQLLARNWGAALSVIGAGGLPELESGGNVQRPGTALKLSFRLPPTLDGEQASEVIRRALESNPPYGAQVRFEAESAATGWNAPDVAPWLEEACQTASEAVFGKPAMYTGEGGTIPFMSMLGESFPEAQFLITGVLGPNSNAHGPNEFLHLSYATRLTAAVALVLDAHARHHN